MSTRNISLGSLALLGALCVACSDDGNDMIDPDPAEILCEDAGVIAANVVGLRCGGQTIEAAAVSIVLGGPAMGTTQFRGLSFDLVYDPARLRFEEGTPPPSTTMPDATINVSLFQDTQGRVVVSLVQPGALPAVQVGTGQHQILTLPFERVSEAAFGPTAVMIQNGQATAAVPAINFAGAVQISNE